MLLGLSNTLKKAIINTWDNTSNKNQTLVGAILSEVLFFYI